MQIPSDGVEDPRPQEWRAAVALGVYEIACYTLLFHNPDQFPISWRIDERSTGADSVRLYDSCAVVFIFRDPTKFTPADCFEVISHYARVYTFDKGKQCGICHIQKGAAAVDSIPSNTPVVLHAYIKIDGFKDEYKYVATSETVPSELMRTTIPMYSCVELKTRYAKKKDV